MCNKYGTARNDDITSKTNEQINWRWLNPAIGKASEQAMEQAMEQAKVQAI